MKEYDSKLELELFEHTENVYAQHVTNKDYVLCNFINPNWFKPKPSIQQ